MGRVVLDDQAVLDVSQKTGGSFTVDLHLIASYSYSNRFSFDCLYTSTMKIPTTSSSSSSAPRDPADGSKRRNKYCSCSSLVYALRKFLQAVVIAYFGIIFLIPFVFLCILRILFRICLGCVGSAGSEVTLWRHGVYYREHVSALAYRLGRNDADAYYLDRNFSQYQLQCMYDERYATHGVGVAPATDWCWCRSVRRTVEFYGWLWWRLSTKPLRLCGGWAGVCWDNGGSTSATVASWGSDARRGGLLGGRGEGTSGAGGGVEDQI